MNIQSIIVTSALLASSNVYAAEIAVGTLGQFFDTHRHVVVMNGSEDDARLEYAKLICRERTGTIAGGSVVAPGTPEEGPRPDRCGAERDRKMTSEQRRLA